MRTTSLALAFVIAAAALPAFAEPDAAAGQAAVTAQCQGCHSGMIAPVLKGVTERNIASVEGYAYSASLSAKKAEKWTDANLDAFLSGPRTFAADSKMGVSVADAGARANIIAYLKTLK